MVSIVDDFFGFGFFCVREIKAVFGMLILVPQIIKSVVEKRNEVFTFYPVVMFAFKANRYVNGVLVKGLYVHKKLCGYGIVSVMIFCQSVMIAVFITVKPNLDPIFRAFGFGDQVAPAKALSKFIKDSKKGEILAAAMDGKLMSAKEAMALATLPSKAELYAKMLGCVNSPASGIANSVNAVMSSLVRAVAAVRDQKSA